MKQFVQERTGAAHLRRHPEGLLHLAEHLRLAHDERIEARGDAEQMVHRLAPGLGVQMWCELVDRYAVEVGEEPMDRGGRRFSFVARDVHLYTVAGRDNGSFVMRKRSDQRGKRAIDTSGREIEPLAQLDGRGAMTDAHQQQLHQKL